jgi:hypothetical protein
MNHPELTARGGWSYTTHRLPNFGLHHFAVDLEFEIDLDQHEVVARHITRSVAGRVKARLRGVDAV